MAKKPKMTDDAPSAPRPAGPNSYDRDVVLAIVESVEDVQAQIDKIMQAAKDECAPLREDIAEIKKSANEDDGLPRKELNSILQKRRLLRKAEDVRNKLSTEQQDEFDNLEHALGMLSDTPLGQAAISAADGAVH